MNSIYEQSYTFTVHADTKEGLEKRAEEQARDLLGSGFWFASFVISESKQVSAPTWEATVEAVTTTILVSR